MNNTLTIGQLAEQAATSVVTIRYYERQGLIPKSKRSPGGYRLYPIEMISRLYFIKNAKAVGFSLKEISMLLSLQQNKRAPSRNVKNLALSKIDEIKKKVKMLKTMQKALEAWAAACDGKVPVEQCPILENLYQRKMN